MDKRNTDTELRDAFATVLRRRRHKLGINQEELAFRANVTRRFISLLETEKRQPTLSTLSALAQGLETTLSAFIIDIEEQAGKKD